MEKDNNISQEAARLRNSLWKRFRKATACYSLLSDGDKILIGLSGGKDSLLLVEMLGQQARIFKPSIKVEACHVRMRNVKYETDTSYLEQFCERWNMPLHIVTTSFDSSIPTSKPM